MRWANLWGNRMMVRLINWIIWGAHFTDVSCGFRAYSRDTALQLNLFGRFSYTQEMFIDLAGKDLTGQKVLEAMESGAEFLDIFNSPPSKFSKTNHLANTITQVQQIKNGRWVVIKEGLAF